MAGNRKLALQRKRQRISTYIPSATQARNNRLELQTRNNGKLLSALDSLLEKLQLPVAVEKSLTVMRFNEAK